MWKLSKDLIFPVADITSRRFFFGKFLRRLAPKVPSLSRKKDNTWSEFLAQVTSKSILIFVPEGRMKRRNGLDKNGKPMTARGGVCDVLDKIKTGKLLFVYSGGLHHVLAPGDSFPKFFKRIKVRAEIVDIASYVKKFQTPDGLWNRQAIRENLETRRDKLCPVL